jgi:hypothetical protein
MKKANFNEIYNELYMKNSKDFEDLRKGVIVKSIVIIAFAVILECFFIKFITNGKYSSGASFIYLSIMFLMVIIPFILKQIFNTFAYNYKSKIIKALVEYSNPSYTFSSQSGVSSREYNESGFDTSWDEFYSEDGVKGTIENDITVRMSQVKTIKETTYTDEDGTHESKTVTFLGLYGIINLPFTSLVNLSIFPNSKFSMFDKSRIDMESSDFEKYYDVYSNDRVGTMEILTPESVEKLIELKNSYKGKAKIYIKVCENKIYFRIGCGDIFEPPKFKNSMGFDVLYDYFQIIDTPRAIYESMIDNIIEKNDNREFKNKRKIANMTTEERKEYEEQKEKEEESNFFSHS